MSIYIIEMYTLSVYIMQAEEHEILKSRLLLDYVDIPVLLHGVDASKS